MLSARSSDEVKETADFLDSAKTARVAPAAASKTHFQFVRLGAWVRPPSASSHFDVTAN